MLCFRFRIDKVFEIIKEELGYSDLPMLNEHTQHVVEAGKSACTKGFGQRRLA